MKRIAAVFLLALTILGEAGSTQTTNVAEAIYFNGKVITLDTTSSIQQAFATEGERFVAVGTNAEIRALAGKHLMSVPDEQILETHPLATFVGGRNVYSAPGFRLQWRSP